MDEHGVSEPGLATSAAQLKKTESDFEPDLDLSKDGYRAADVDNSNSTIGRLALLAQTSDTNDPIFATYPILQRAQLAELELELGKYWAKFKNRQLTEWKWGPNGEETDMKHVRTLFREYCQALRDFEYMLHLRKPTAEMQRREWRARQDWFQTEDLPGFRTHYGAFSNTSTSLGTDRLMQAISNVLPKQVAWPTREKKRRPNEYLSNLRNKNEKPSPQDFSATTRFLAGIVITLFAAAWLVVPIVIMTFPVTANDRAWDIVTLTIAIVLFGAFVAAIVPPQSNTKDVIAATAAYAAVLVVFYGNTR